MTRVDLPKNKSKLCQTLSLCFWFRTTKWITKEIFRVHTAGIVLNLKWELNKLNRGAMSTVCISHHGRRADCLLLYSSALQRQWSHRSFLQAVRNMSHLLSFLLGCSYSLPGPLLIHPFMGGGDLPRERELTPLQLIVLRDLHILIKIF